MPSNARIEELKARIAQIEQGSGSFSTQRLVIESTQDDSNDAFLTAHSNHPAPQNPSDVAILNKNSSHSDTLSAFKKIQSLVSFRDRSSKELHDRLLTDGYDEQSIRLALEKAIACGFINDIRFSENLIRSRLAQGKGIKGIQAELAKHGISYEYAISKSSYIADMVEESDSEVQRALSLLNKKHISAKNKYQAAYRRCLSAGYSTEVAYEASKQWISQQA